MATKVNAAAAGAKRRQQIIVLAVGGVLLAGLVMLQAPKIMHHGKSSTTSASTSTPSSGTDSATSNTTTTADSGSSTGATTSPSATPSTPAPAVIANGPAAKVAGVIVRSAGAPRPEEGHLWSLSRFKVRDPFVQQVVDKSATATSTGSAGSSTGATGSDKSAAGAKTEAGKTSVVVPTTVTPAAIAYLTLMVNGNAQQLTLKDVFPKGQPTFVVRGVAKNVVKIGVAGGKFVGGAVVKLELGKAVTLMNTATGQRFVMKLVYTGSQPEQIAGFKTPGVPSATTPAVVVPSTTPASTAAPKA
jgi:hypothetical protein